MIDRLTLHYSLQDIADYFRECLKKPGDLWHIRLSLKIEPTKKQVFLTASDTAVSK